MDDCPVDSPLTGPQRGGHVSFQLRQPKDGPVPVGSGRFPQRPPFNASSEFQRTHDGPSVDSGHSGTQPLNNLPPGSTPDVASSPWPLSCVEIMDRCTEMMEQLINQQHKYQQALLATKSAMATAPSSSFIQPALKSHQPVEVMSAARRDQELGLNQSGDPVSSARVCYETAGSIHIPVHTNLTNSFTTSQQIESPAPLPQTRAPAASEVGLQPAGEKICDVTSDDHHTRKLVQVGKQRDQHREADNEDSSNQRFQTKHANPSSRPTIEASASKTAQHDIPAGIFEQFIVWPASFAAYGAIEKMFGWHKQSSSPYCKVEACANGSLQLFIASGRQRSEQGKSQAFVDRFPPWPPPTLAAHSLKLNFIKFRGGREDSQTFWILSLDKFINQPNVCLSTNSHRKQINCGSNCDARERPLCHQILVVLANSLTIAVILHMITSPVPDPPLNPMQLTPRTSTSEPAVQPEMSLRASSMSRRGSLPSQEADLTLSPTATTYLPTPFITTNTSEPTIVLQLVFSLQRIHQLF